jgi:hypothetical protein
MGIRLDQLIEGIRASKGSFFIARLHLRLKFQLNAPNLPDSLEYEHQLVEACNVLGFDIEPLRKELTGPISVSRVSTAPMRVR